MNAENSVSISKRKLFRCEYDHIIELKTLFNKCILIYTTNYYLIIAIINLNIFYHENNCLN